TGSFYDKSGAIGDTTAVASPTATSFRGRDTGDAASSRGDDSDDDDADEYCLTGYGEMSSDTPFMLPPSPTETVKYRYRAYRPKLARISKKYRAAANGGTGKTKSNAYHSKSSSPSALVMSSCRQWLTPVGASTQDYASMLGPYFEGLTGRSPKRDFQALLHKYRESAEGWRDTESYTSPRKTYSPAGTPTATPTSTPLRREGSRQGRNAF
ncbi:hypothetical protein LXA43DRAFT_888186, partial [Ganoderma leucocontextum]